MPTERIDRYKKTARLRFRNEETENAYQKIQRSRGRSTSIYALLALCVLNISFALLEHWILGIKSMIPLFGYTFVAVVSLGIGLFGIVNSSKAAMTQRMLIPGVMTFAVLMGGIFLQQYRIYHAIEIALLVVWLGSLNVYSFRWASGISLAAMVAFTSMAYFFGATDLKLTGLILLQLASFSLALYLSYMLERFRRMMFLTTHSLQDINDRQESWAYTLIDLDMALSGIRNFNEMISRLMEYIKPVIEYDSFVFTHLEGKGPKPSPDEVDGTLFEQEDATIWSEDLLTKLSQTRQADTSAQFELSKGFLGREKQNFQHFRMDIPVFSDSSMVGVISLRRESNPYDDLDMTASVSLTSQAMMIYKRTNMASQMSDTLVQKASDLAKQQTAAAPAAKEQTTAEKPQPIKPEVAPQKPVDNPIVSDMTQDHPLAKEESHSSVDLDITSSEIGSESPKQSASTTQGRDETVIPKAVLDKMKADSASAKKTITLLSRENADQIAVDRYRTAAVEGEPLSILLFEVDGLSAIREKDGDQTAYKVFAGIVKYIFSKTDPDRDVLGRYGQNGLSVLLPRVDMNAAEKFAESIRQYAESAKFKTPYGERGATLSIGVAAITDETGNYDSMVKRADMALFVAKKNGRNCVKVRL